MGVCGDGVCGEEVEECIIRIGCKSFSDCVRAM